MGQTRPATEGTLRQAVAAARGEEPPQAPPRSRPATEGTLHELVEAIGSGSGGGGGVVEGYYYQGAMYQDAQHATAIVGRGGVIYVDVATDSTYRWNGEAYESLSSSIDVATRQEAEAGVDDTKAMTPLKTKQAIEALTPRDLGITGASVGQVATVSAVDEAGRPTAWSATNPARTLTVTLAKNFGEGAVNGPTVTVRAGSASSSILGQLAYEGQPVAFALPTGQRYHVSVTGLSGYVSPDPVTGTIGTTDAAVTMTYETSMGAVPIWDEGDNRYEDTSVARWVRSWVDGLAYGVRLPKGSSTECAKTGANAGIANPTPGWVGHAGTDPYATLGPFRHVNVNGFVDADGTPHVTGIEGDAHFALDGSNGDVWVLAPVLYWSYEDDGESYVTYTVSDTQLAGMAAQPQAYLPDGTLRPYMLYAKYPGGTGSDGHLHTYSGLATRTYDVSHDTLPTMARSATTGYSGLTHDLVWYVQLMFLLKYATKNSQSIFAGCTNYNLSYRPAVAEDGVRRVVVTSAQASALLVGSSVTLGTTANGTQVCDKARIAGTEQYDSSNVAVLLDIDHDIDVKTTHYLCTTQWHAGSCDLVSGDGTPTQSGQTSGKEPCVLQGIELFVGCTEVVGNVAIVGDGTTQTPYVNPDSRNEVAGAIAESAVAADTPILASGNGGNLYPYYPYGETDVGLLYGTGYGASQTTGTCDLHYLVRATQKGVCEWLAFGHLGDSAYAGLWCVGGDGALSGADWDIGSRLSGTGRGRGAA